MQHHPHTEGGPAARRAGSLRWFGMLPSIVRRLTIVPLTLSMIIFADTSVAGASPETLDQWYLERIGVAEAHTISQGEGVLIGMFTIPVATDLPGLRGRVRPYKRVGLLGRVTDLPLDPDLGLARGYDVGRLGLIVAGGELGVLGVAPQAEVQPMQQQQDPATLSPALRWLVDNGASVIDVSGAPMRESSGAVSDGIRYALANDVVVVADAASLDRLPASATTGILVVGDVDEADETRPRRRIDPRIDLVAPATHFGMPGLSSDPSRNGVSPSMAALPERAAAALTTGAAALIRAAHPELNAASVIDRLITTAEDLGTPGPDATYGHGMLDVSAALTADKPAVSVNPLGDPGPPDVRRGWALPRIMAWFSGIAMGVGALMTAGFGSMLLLRRSRRKLHAPVGPR